MNGKKALFFIIALAGTPNGPKYVQTHYPPLDSWWHNGEMYRHNSTGQVGKRLRQDDVICRPSGQNIDPTSQPERPEPPAAGQEGSRLTRSLVEKMEWSDEHKMYYYWDSSNNCKGITQDVVLLDQVSGKQGVFVNGSWKDVLVERESAEKGQKRRKVEGKKTR